MDSTFNLEKDNSLKTTPVLAQRGAVWSILTKNTKRQPIQRYPQGLLRWFGRLLRSPPIILPTPSTPSTRVKPLVFNGVTSSPKTSNSWRQHCFRLLTSPSTVPAGGQPLLLVSSQSPRNKSRTDRNEYWCSCPPVPRWPMPVRPSSCVPTLYVNLPYPRARGVKFRVPSQCSCVPNTEELLLPCY